MFKPRFNISFSQLSISPFFTKIVIFYLIEVILYKIYNIMINQLEHLIFDHIQDTVNVLLRNIALSVFLVILFISILTFIISHIVYKYHRRIKNKFAVYVLNNSWISLLAQRISFAIELNGLVEDPYDTYWNDEIIPCHNFFSKVKYHFGFILRNVMSYLDIAECKNYFRFKNA